MAYLAKYSGTCTKCGKGFNRYRDWITHDRSVKGRYYHVDCSNPDTKPGNETPQEPQEAPQETPQEAPQEQEAPIQLTPENEAPSPQEAPSPTNPNDPFAAMATALIPHLQGKIGFNPEAINRVIETKAQEAKRDFDSLFVARIDTVKSELINALDNHSTKLEVTLSPEGKRVKVDNAHPMLKRLIYLVSKRKHAYCHGPAGSGKSHGARQASEALGLGYGFIALNDMTMPSALLGYQTVSGDYVRTPFRDCYENGGVFCIDEMDNANGNLLTTLNSALANGHCAFPDGIIARHADFVCVGTGNTVGNGGDRQFADRRAFDAATKDRFAFIYWPYDRKLERNIALSLNEDATPWVNWIHSVRQFCESRYPDLVVSPRATFGGAEILADSGWDIETVAETVLFKGLDKSAVSAIIAACPYPEYKPTETEGA